MNASSFLVLQALLSDNSAKEIVDEVPDHRIRELSEGILKLDSTETAVLTKSQWHYFTVHFDSPHMLNDTNTLVVTADASAPIHVYASVGEKPTLRKYAVLARSFVTADDVYRAQVLLVCSG